MSHDKKLSPSLSGPVRHACLDVIESPRAAVEHQVDSPIAVDVLLRSDLSDGRSLRRTQPNRGGVDGRCQGTITKDFGAPRNSTWGEPAQLDHLDGASGLVTLSIGGNDAKFGWRATSFLQPGQVTGGSEPATR